MGSGGGRGTGEGKRIGKCRIFKCSQPHPKAFRERPHYCISLIGYSLNVRRIKQKERVDSLMEVMKW